MLVFVVLVIMSTSWLFALLVIVRGKDLSPRSEKLVSNVHPWNVFV